MGNNSLIKKVFFLLDKNLDVITSKGDRDFCGCGIFLVHLNYFLK